MPSEQGSRNLSSYLLIAPTLAVVVVFLVLPLILVLRVSFLQHVPLGYTEQLTPDNYDFVFTNEGVRNTLAFTIETASIVTAGSLLLAYPVAYFLARKVMSFTVKTAFLVFLLIPFWIDFTTRSLAWTGYYRRDLDQRLQVIEPGAKLGRYEIRAKIGAGGMGEVYLAQDTKLDRKVALKKHNTDNPGMGIGCVFVFLASLADFATPKLIGGLVTSIGELIRDNVTFVNLPNASAISALVVVIALAVLVLTFRLAHVEQIFE